MVSFATEILGRRGRGANHADAEGDGGGCDHQAVT
jgi:hypothetical protein